MGWEISEDLAEVEMIPLFAEVVTQQQAIHMVLHNLLASLAYGIAGIGLMVAAFKTFDWMTPGHLGQEILEKGNIAAAILATGFLLAVALIVAAAFS